MLDSHSDGRSRARRSIRALHLLAQSCLCGAVCIAPWCLGAVEPDVELLIDAAVLCSLGFWCIAAFVTYLKLDLAPVRFPPLILLLLGGLLIGAFQLQATRQVKSRPDLAYADAKAEVRKVAEADSATWSSELGSRETFGSKRKLELKSNSITPISSLLPEGYSLNTLATARTRYELARFSMAVIAFFLGVVLFQSQSSQTGLWVALAANGAALSLFGIVQFVSWTKSVYWTIPLSVGGRLYASYVNRNNAAGYLCLTLAAAVGVVFWASARGDWIDSCRKIISEGNRKYPYWLYKRVAYNARAIVASMDVLQLAGALIVLLILAGILGSLSRTVVLATAVAGMICLFLRIRLRGELKSPLAITIELGLFVAGIVIWTGVVVSLAAQLGIFMSRVEVRANWHDALKVLDDFPVTGTGLGTYRYAYLPYQTLPEIVPTIIPPKVKPSLWFCHADNQFVEILVEAGVLGVALVVLAIFACLGSTLAFARNLQRPPNDPAGIVGTFIVVSQSVIACFDFGPVMTANMLTLALVLGAVTGRSARFADKEDSRSWWLSFPGLRPAWLILPVGIAFLVHGIVGWAEIGSVAQSRKVWRGIPKQLDSSNTFTDQQLDGLINRLTGAIRNRPDDAEAHRLLGQLWIYRFRKASFEELTRRNGVRDGDWERTDLASIYSTVNHWESTGETRRIDALRDSMPVKENLYLARRHFLAAQKSSPLQPGVDLPLTMLEFLDPDGKTTGLDHLVRAVSLTPLNPEVFESASVLAEAIQKHDLAYGWMRTELLIKPEALEPIASHLNGGLPIDDQIEHVLPDSPIALVELASTMYSGADQVQARRALLKKAIKVLTDQSEWLLQEGPGIRLLAQAHFMLGDLDSAAFHYRHALTLDPLQSDWRLELVKVLKLQDRISLAVKQAELCLAVDPEQAEALDLLSVLRAEVNSEPAQENP